MENCQIHALKEKCVARYWSWRTILWSVNNSHDPNNKMDQSLAYGVHNRRMTTTSRHCVCANKICGWHTQGGKENVKNPVRRKGGRAGLPARVSGRHVVRGRQSSPTLEVRLGEQARLVKTVNIQVRCGSSAWTRPSAPECGDTLKALAGDQRPI